MKKLFIILLLVQSTWALKPFQVGEYYYRNLASITDSTGKILELSPMMNGILALDMFQYAIPRDQYFTLNDSVVAQSVTYLFKAPERSTGIKVFGDGGWKSDEPSEAIIYLVAPGDVTDTGTFIPTYSANLYTGFTPSGMKVWIGSTYTNPIPLFSDILGTLSGPKGSSGGFSTFGGGFILPPGDDYYVVVILKNRGSPNIPSALIKPLFNWTEYE